MQRAYWSLGKTELLPLNRKRWNEYRLTCLLKQYEKYQHRPTSKFEAEMSKIFDITNQMESGSARRTRSYIKTKLNVMVVLDISQIKSLP